MRSLEEIEASEKQMLVPTDIADYIGADAQSIRLQARANAAALGFPVILVGTRTLIPKDGFVRFCRALNVEPYLSAPEPQIGGGHG